VPVPTTTLVYVDDHAPPAEVPLPAGYRRVWRGALCPGDLCLSRGELLHCNRVVWVRLRPKELALTADMLACVVRFGAPCDVECSRCRVRAAEVGWEVCRGCRQALRR
jgi:hypothetical protein